jgi:hypothetical protein
LDCKSHIFPLFGPFFLVRRCGSKSSVEGDIIRFSICRASLDIAPAFTVCLGARPPPSLAAGDPVEWIV